jgi:M6 family metalloprotease-like protein
LAAHETTRYWTVPLASLLALALSGLAAAQPLAPVQGWLTVVWGDPDPGGEEPPAISFFLTDRDQAVTEITIDSEVLSRSGGLMQLDNSYAEVTFAPPPPGLVGGGLPVATSIRPTAPPAGIEDRPRPLGGTGSKPWISLTCKFSDIPAEPENLGYFLDMYQNAPGRLDHYWREVSYDVIDVVGSTAIDWLNLPGSHSTYVPTPGSGTGADLSALFDDCTAVADPFVDFSNGGTGSYEGINLMFNEVLDCCAWGGSFFATLDGVSKSWRTTWNPPWAFHQEAVIAHEMGHGFGLPHANNSDGDSNPYDSPWDVMSSATGYAVDDPIYGNLGKHVTTFHKEVLGWIDPSQRFEVSQPGVFQITLDPLGSASTTTYRMAKIPIGGSNSHYYTVEVREAAGQYEADIPGSGPGDRMVILHEVLTSRSEPAWVLDADQPPADYADTEGVMWRPGEIFIDPANEIAIRVVSPTATGFNVEISFGTALIFSDGFESGDTTAWSTITP